MCGISGIWGSEDAPACAAMVAAMRHRGPDDEGVYRDANVVLGMTRLSIIDVGPHGHQPMRNADGTVCIVYNGEVYNFQSERRLLEARGHRFDSASDTEVVLRMYEHYGDDFLSRLRGMFALAIYDRRRGPGRERLLLARDHFGVKPLLYARAGGRLVFASELKALLASGLVRPEVDPEALRLLLTCGTVAQPHTMLRGVHMLMPAHRLVVERGGVERVERYWSLGLDRREGLRDRPYEEAVAELAGAIEESVRLHLISDVPVGAFLSGGVDSSLLVALMSRAGGRRVKTFSVGFEAEGADLDETDEAARTAEYLGADHTRVLVRGDEVRERIRHIAFSLDQPSTDGVNTYFVSRAAGREVKVAVSGTGSDELFAGYYWFGRMVHAQREREREPFKAAARSLLAYVAKRPVLDPFLPGRGGSALLAARSGGGFLARYDSYINYSFDPRRAARLLQPELRRDAQAGRAPEFDQRGFDELPGGSTVERVTGLSLRGYMNNQLLRDTDAVSMAHSLEVRVPFIDRHIVDLALSLPVGAKLGERTDHPRAAPNSYRAAGTKRIIVDAARPFLPEGFDTYPKRGFVLPCGAWLRGPLREVMLDTLGDASVRARGLLDAGEVAAVRREFEEGRYNNYMGWAKPWLLMMLELWGREVLDRPARALASF